jgi:hypothetical protein
MVRCVTDPKGQADITHARTSTLQRRSGRTPLALGVLVLTVAGAVIAPSAASATPQPNPARWGG